jgi:O-antigen/teichoic acid export membrane protein
MSRLPEAGIGVDGEASMPEQGWPRLGGLRPWTRLGSKMSYALADQVTYSFGNMVVAALLSRHAAAREFGMYILTQRALDVLIQLCSVFSWGPYMFNLPSIPKERIRRYDGSMVTQQMVGCVLSAMLLWGASRWASTSARGLYFGIFAPLVWTSVGILFREFTRRLYFSQMRFCEAFWTDAATVGLQIAGVEWLYRVHRLTLPATLEVLSAGAILVSMWWVVREWSSFEVRWRANVEDMRLNLKLGRWLFGGNMVFMVSSQCNPWVLSAVLGGAGVGAYAVCESVVNIPRVALTSMQNVMAPTLARAFADGGKPALRKAVRRIDQMLLVGSALFACGIAVFGPWAARLIFKTTPENARTLLVLLALNFVAFSATTAQGYGLTAMNRASYAFYAYIAGLAAQVAVTVWFVHAFKLPGAALALLTGSVVVLVVRQVLYVREMQGDEMTPELRQA